MKRITTRTLLTLLLLLVGFANGTAQEQQREQRRPRHFSHEEFQARQREFITEKADLTPEEANAFFPLFFELQGKKFELERNARRAIRREGNENISEEQCLQYVNNMADVRIEIATLEKEYTTKYLEVIPACKLLRVQQAEHLFQRHLMREMTGNRGRRNNNENR